MSFYIFTGVLIGGAIFIAHYAANRFGFRLFYSSLFISALLAVAINFAVISMKDVSSPGSVGKILLLVLLAFAGVTVFNDLLTRLEKKKLMNRRHKAKELKEADLVESEEVAEDISTEEEVPVSENIQIEEKVSIDEDIPVEENIPLEKAKDNEKDSAEIKKGKFSFIKRLFSKEKKATAPKKPDFSNLDTLDAILDFAYEARLSGRYHDAVAAYEEAIDRYADDAYLPFIFIDLGNAHKETGEYDAAIDVYKKALNMERIKSDPATSKSFAENTTYLKALKITLRNHKMEHTPFSQISKEILDEADKRVKHKEAENEEKQ